ncbi:hypothetical protein [Microbacterium jejuense]|uniref:hypothetical protein n=1 Tax=Microbacterium jejuense TaxID=1263637 RepID=UPI0031EF8EB7
MPALAVREEPTRGVPEIVGTELPNSPALIVFAALAFVTVVYPLRVPVAFTVIDLPLSAVCSV